MSYNFSMNRIYKELIFTNHALARLKQRNVGMGEVWAAWKRPTKSHYAETKGGWVFQRSWGKRQIEVVAKQNESREWIVLSVWANQLRYRPQRPMWLRLLKWVWKKIRNDKIAANKL